MTAKGGGKGEAMTVSHVKRGEVERMLARCERFREFGPTHNDYDMADICRSWLAQRELLEEVAKYICRGPGTLPPCGSCIHCQARQMLGEG